MTDEEIVVLVQKGETEKFGEIVGRYEKKLYWYIKGLVNQKDEEVEDLLQEVFIGAYENIREFDTKKKFSSWIYRIAHNKAIDFFRKKRVKIADIDIGEWDELFEAGNKLFEEIEIELEEKKKLGRIIGQLEVKYKEVVLLYFFEDKSYEEISDILQIPSSNVGVMLFRAKKQLKEKMTNEKNKT